MNILNNSVFVYFLSGRKVIYHEIAKVDTDINYSMYQLTAENGCQSFIDSKVIEYIEFGRGVKIIEH